MKDGKHLILCIDDDEDLLENLTIVLEAHGYATRTANTAEEGLRALAGCEPDLVIVDLMMEEIDAGTNFVKDLRAKGAQVPIYLLSSIGDSMASSVANEDLGLAGILQKPVDNTALLTILRERLQPC